MNDKAYKTRVVNNANAPEQDMVVRSSEAWTFKRVCESAADALNQALISNAITNPAPNVTGRQLAAMYRNMEQRVFSDGFLENVEDSGPEVGMAWGTYSINILRIPLCCVRLQFHVFGCMGYHSYEYAACEYKWSLHTYVF